MEWLWQAVVSGIVIAMILSVARLIVARYREKREIAHIRNALVGTYWKVTTPNPILAEGISIPEDRRRLEVFLLSLTLLECLLTHRTATLRAEYLHPLMGTVLGYRELLGYFEIDRIDHTSPMEDPRYPKGMEFYERFFHELDALEWLELKEARSPAG